MPIFSIFDVKNEYRRTLTCDEVDLFLNLQLGEKYIVGEYQDHYLVNNQPVQKPPRPSEYHNWDAAGKVWSADLEGAKAAMWDKIQAERTRRTEGGYPCIFGGKTYWFHSDAMSLSQQQGLVSAAQLTMIQGKDMAAVMAQWKTKSGEFVGMTGNLALAMFQAGMAQQQAIFTAAEIHKAKMRACAEPWNYDYSAGWPKIYGEE